MCTGCQVQVESDVRENRFVLFVVFRRRVSPSRHALRDGGVLVILVPCLFDQDERLVEVAALALSHLVTSERDAEAVCAAGHRRTFSFVFVFSSFPFCLH
jgi:hypothetical protein